MLSLGGVNGPAQGPWWTCWSVVGRQSINVLVSHRSAGLRSNCSSLSQPYNPIRLLAGSRPPGDETAIITHVPPTATISSVSLRSVHERQPRPMLSSAFNSPQIPNEVFSLSFAAPNNRPWLCSLCINNSRRKIPVVSKIHK
ncbi:hypothetical protein PoMZ_13547 [Pyricularia oryzae]|uniref:Uncharacterized protein n=1 Tax=Pyricularia oryzae TaxID=318829 RepID=A0A4P7NVC4_PYROR|nr:hypothetical protein PoMZ_13547 [Pyricularia oryzae]